MATEYGSRLKQARKHAGFTQVELSKKTGIPQSTISTAEREGHGSGETPVYAQACGVNALWLANGSGSMADDFLTLNQPVETVNNAQAAINNIATLEQSLEGLAHYLAGLNESDRADMMRSIAVLEKEPERHAKQAAGIRAMVGAAFAQSPRKAA